MENLLEAVLLGDGDDNDVEFIILDHILREEYEERLGPVFTLDNLSDEEVVENFRFERCHLLRLKNVLNIPDEINTHAGDHIDGLTALCIVLKRLSYPCRLADLRHFFNMSPQRLSQIIRKTTEIIYEEKGGLLTNLFNLNWLNQERMQLYANALQLKGGAIPNCWGFIDGTIRPMCRPSINQEEYYSGHKRVHCLKYQSILSPDGIVVSLMGAFPGRRHDAGIFRYD